MTEEAQDQIIEAGSLEYALYSIETKEIPAFIKPSDSLIPSPVQTEQSAPEKPPSPITFDPNSWSCALCTFCNDSSSPRCEMCGSVNPNRRTSEDDSDNIIEAQENTPSTPAVYAVWMCSQCTFMNQMDALR